MSQLCAVPVSLTARARHPEETSPRRKDVLAGPATGVIVPTAAHDRDKVAIAACGLEELPRAGQPRRISAADQAAVVALAC